MKQDFESELDSVTSKFNSELQKVNLENNALICQNKDLLQINEKHIEEISSLKKKLTENVYLLQNLQENEIVDKIKEELSKMKNRYETEVGSLRDDKYILEKVVDLISLLSIEHNCKMCFWTDIFQTIDELREKLRNIENVRQNIISSLYVEIKVNLLKFLLSRVSRLIEIVAEHASSFKLSVKRILFFVNRFFNCFVQELMSKERGEEAIWPEELIMFRELFHSVESQKLTLSNERNNEPLNEVMKSFF